MTSKILKAILTVAVTVIVLSLVIIVGVLYPYFRNVHEDQLVDELSLSSKAVEISGKEYLESLESERYRLTWVKPDGSVIFDTHADASVMENHGNREEIKEALAIGSGSSIRHSDTLTQETIYEAVRLKDGSILRISVSRATALLLMLGMIPPIAIVLIIAIALSVFLARSMAKRVVEPLNKLNLDKPLENDVYDELSPLLYRIHAQHLEIEEQMKTLKKKQDEFDQITCNMRESLVLLDQDSRILSINPAAIKLFQTDIDCIGEDFLTLDRRQNIRRSISEAREQGHSLFRDSINGREYQFDLSLIESDGNTQGIVILAFDITEQVNAEKNRQEFTANVSHELKTPLQSIIGSAELMENGIVKDEDIPRFVGRIRSEASRLVDLIDDIIRLSQLDEKAEMQREYVSLNELADEVICTLSEAAEQKDISLDFKGDNSSINGVRRLLYEIIYNLCDNAIKYNKKGGEVKIRIREAGERVVLSVQDNGIGISREHQEKIFERFYRVDKSHSKQSGGTGLGLSIVKHAVQYHGAQIILESELNIGTRISVIF